MLDIIEFRENPEKIRESQRIRFGKKEEIELVDEVIELDKIWRQRQYELDGLNAIKNKFSKVFSQAKEDAGELVASAEEMRKQIAKKKAEVKEALEAVDSRRCKIGNIVHDSVPVHEDESNNVIIRTWGEKPTIRNLKNHVDLVELLEIAEFQIGTKVAGNRGYYLIGDGEILNQALLNFGREFLIAGKGFNPIRPPYFMEKEIMAKCAQLAEFDGQLYKVSGDGDDKYLIATSEQPLCAKYQKTTFLPSELPIRNAGNSTCFRTEAGTQGRDTTGLFRLHQFEKIEQFCVTSPTDSWEMFEEMLKNSEEFYQQLKIPYQVVSVVSGALNATAAKKYDLEGWFPASNKFRELVSCSNCTDYQSRRLGIQYGQKQGDAKKEYVHLLNSTLVATERTMCAILENYQTEDGVKIPEVLVKYMYGKTFIPFKKQRRGKTMKGKKSKE